MSEGYVTIRFNFSFVLSYPTVEGVVELGAADMLLTEPGGATLLGEELAADRFIRPVVALRNSVARHGLLHAQAAFASEVQNSTHDSVESVHITYP